MTTNNSEKDARQTSGGWAARADRLAAAHIAAGDPTGWFEDLYGAGIAGEVPMPWDRDEPNPLLVEWLEARDGSAPRDRAVVVGCGLGQDAEYLAHAGFTTTGFDIAATAIRVAKQRHPDSAVDYTVADLLDLPAPWAAAFDLVVESYTVQALPDPPRAEAIRGVTQLVAPGGTLLVIAFRSDDPDVVGDGPPWPLRQQEIDSFARDGLVPTSIEALTDRVDASINRWRAEFHRRR